MRRGDVNGETLPAVGARTPGLPTGFNGSWDEGHYRVWCLLHGVPPRTPRESLPPYLRAAWLACQAVAVRALEEEPPADDAARSSRDALMFGVTVDDLPRVAEVWRWVWLFDYQGE